MNFRCTDLIWSEELSQKEKEQIRNVINIKLTKKATVIRFLMVMFSCMFLWALILHTYSLINIPLLTFRKFIILIVLIAAFISSVVALIWNDSRNKDLDCLYSNGTGVIRCRLVRAQQASIFSPKKFLLTVEMNENQIRDIKLHYNNCLSDGGEINSLKELYNKNIVVMCNANGSYFQPFIA